MFKMYLNGQKEACGRFESAGTADQGINFFMNMHYPPRRSTSSQGRNLV